MGVNANQKANGARSDLLYLVFGLSFDRTLYVPMVYSVQGIELGCRLLRYFVAEPQLGYERSVFVGFG